MLDGYMSSAPSERRSRHRHTYAEYLAYERDSGLKHEYEDGEIVAVAHLHRRPVYWLRR
jgi:hypothetical protein